MDLGNYGALSRLGIVTTPVGTLEEIKEAGLDPETVACCHRRSPSNPGGDGGVRGCPVWNDCRFHQPDMGGFKGQGPRNVPYRLTTLDGKSQMNFVPCYAFVRTLQGRMDHANSERIRGRSHEVLHILPVPEGGTIKMNIATNPDYNPRIRNDNGYFVTDVHEVVVKPHPRPKDLSAVGFEAEIKKLEDDFKAREQAAMEARSIVPNGEVKKRNEKLGG